MSESSLFLPFQEEGSNGESNLLYRNIPKWEGGMESIYFPEVRLWIGHSSFLLLCQKMLADIGDKGDTLHHSQRAANFGFLFAKHCGLPEQQTKWLSVAGLVHDIGKTKIPLKHLFKLYAKFGVRDRKILKLHPRLGYIFLKHEMRKEDSSRVYNPVFAHHMHQKDPYPDTKGSVLRILGTFDDLDLDNSRRLAMVDVADTLLFGRPSINMYPVSPDQARKILLEQFQAPREEELIDFLISQYVIIKNLLGKTSGRRAIEQSLVV